MNCPSWPREEDAYDHQVNYMDQYRPSSFRNNGVYGNTRGLRYTFDSSPLKFVLDQSMANLTKTFESFMDSQQKGKDRDVCIFVWIMMFIVVGM